MFTHTRTETFHLIVDGAKWRTFRRSWNAPDTVLYNERPYLGAMHVSDLYFLFNGKQDHR